MRRSPRLALVCPRGEAMAALRVGLEDHGFEVVTLTEERSALEQLVDAAPDLICLGVSSPQESGIGLYAKLVGHSRLSRCPVVILRGAAPGRESIASIVASAGVPAPAGVLTDPVDLDELVRTANALLGRPLGVAP